MANIKELKNRNEGLNKQTLSDSDYVLRDKSKEEPGKNTFDITGQTNKYQDELARLKAEARRDVEKELLSSDFLDKLKAQLRAEIAEDSKQTKVK